MYRKAITAAISASKTAIIILSPREDISTPPFLINANAPPTFF